MADDDFDPSEFREPEEDQEERLYRPDKYFVAAQVDLTALFADSPKKDYFIWKLQVCFEEKYFHWISYNAARLNVGSLALVIRNLTCEQRVGMVSEKGGHPCLNFQGSRSADCRRCDHD